MDLEELEELGLTDGQVKVYTAILELGIASINKIQEKTALDRRAIYDIINKLTEKGFITYMIEGGKKTYQCTHPRNLNEEIKKKQKTLESLTKKLPTIKDIYSFKRPSIRAEVYRGNDAMKSLLNEALEYDATHWIGGNSGVEEQTGQAMKTWFKHWMERRVEHKKSMYDLVDYGTHLEDYKPTDIKKHKKHYYKYCALPKDLCAPMVIIIFGNKVAQVLWSKQSFAFVLESKEIRESFMKYFNYFWKDPY